MIRLAVDLAGADTPEEDLCRGAVEAMKNHDELFLYLCGHAERLSPVLEEAALPGRYTIVDSPVAVTNDDDPMTAFKQEDASIVKAMRLAHDGQADGVITCGATGTVLVSSIMILGKLRGLRPILAVELRGKNDRPFLLLDCGANIDSRAELYLAFARLGDAYMRCIGCDAPRIALLSNGAEDKKGCAAVKEAHALLRAEPLRFIGNIEATQALSGETDVIVCDGFHGNILLKSIEGTAKTVIREMEEALGDTPEARAAAEKVRQKYDYNTQGGAVLLGVSRPVMKGHGSATGEAVAKMIVRMADLVRNGFIDKVNSAAEKKQECKS